MISQKKFFLKIDLRFFEVRSLKYYQVVFKSYTVSMSQVLKLIKIYESSILQGLERGEIKLGN